ncbi:MAG: TonB-dependent receptor, partial [Gammaproteobacteria bacterium]
MLSLVLGEQALAQSTTSLKKLSLDELMQVEVTSVSKRAEKLGSAPASIFVISSEDIRRSGASTLPEALRLAPNLEVARMDAVQYAISARGFNNAIGNKLLVLIDGRTVYTPLFSGVFWDQQEVMLEDIERIEVISGPGGTLWGANAVNGVINVITRNASETGGALFVGDVGNNERGGSLRYGRGLDSGAFRIYGKFSNWDHTARADGGAVADAWRRGQLGFRADWKAADGAFTLQGDAYEGHSQDRGSVGTLVI